MGAEGMDGRCRGFGTRDAAHTSPPALSGLFRTHCERKRQAAELEHANQALERSNIELQRFAFVASHDLQTPMRSIASSIERIADATPGARPADADIDSAPMQVDHHGTGNGGSAPKEGAHTHA